MWVVKLAVILLQVSVFLMVFGLGLEATWQDATSLLRRPAMLGKSLLAMNVVMPVFAAIIAGVFHLNPAVKIALVLLAVSPVPPMLPRRQLKLGGTSPYVHGLLTAMSLLAIVVVPLAIEVLGKIFVQDVHIGPMSVAQVVFKRILLPLGLGIVVHSRAPGFAQKASGSLRGITNGLLLVAAVPLLLAAWKPVVGLIGNGTILAIAAFSAVAAAVGHWLGGPEPSERSTLALATASRHPGLAFAIAAANYPAQRMLIAAAILLYLVVSTVVLLPYNAWRRRRLGRTAEQAGPRERAA